MGSLRLPLHLSSNHISTFVSRQSCPVHDKTQTCPPPGGVTHNTQLPAAQKLPLDTLGVKGAPTCAGTMQGRGGIWSPDHPGRRHSWVKELAGRSQESTGEHSRLGTHLSSIMGW